MISIVTISQYKRKDALSLLYKCILSQTLQPNEWVIVEGSHTEEDAEKNKCIISSYDAPFPIVYLAYEEGLKLGGLRNRGNQACSGEIIICMDDDDYYPVMRIQHVKERFDEFPQMNLSGCTNMLLYDFFKNTLYQCRGYHSRHSTNNAMAWRKSFLTTHAHDPSKTFGEESSFTNQFTEPMIQLLPIYTVITSCHSMNTFDKTNVLTHSSFTALPLSFLETLYPPGIFDEYQTLFKEYQRN